MYIEKLLRSEVEEKEKGRKLSNNNSKIGSSSCISHVNEVVESRKQIEHQTKEADVSRGGEQDVEVEEILASINLG